MYQEQPIERKPRRIPIAKSDKSTKTEEFLCIFFAFFSASNFFTLKAGKCGTVSCGSGMVLIADAANVACTATPCSATQCCANGGETAFVIFLFWLLYRPGKKNTGVLFSFLQPIIAPLCSFFSDFLSFFLSFCFICLLICDANCPSILFVVCAAPKCSSYTACGTFGLVLVSDASTKSCSGVECKSGECCTSGVLFLFFFFLCLY